MLSQAQDVLRVGQHLLYCVTKCRSLIIVEVGVCVHNPALDIHNAE